MAITRAAGGAPSGSARALLRGSLRRLRLVPEQVRRGEEHLRLVLVVASAAKLDVGHGRLASDRERPDVVELDECPFAAAPAVRALVGAGAEIPDPDGTETNGSGVRRREQGAEPRVARRPAELAGRRRRHAELAAEARGEVAVAVEAETDGHGGKARRPRRE